MYSIGDFANRTGIPVSALRFYDSKGILIPEIKKENGYRYYSDAQVVKAIFINNLKSIDMPLDIILDLINATDPVEIVQIIRKQKYALLESIKRMNLFELYFNNPQIKMATSSINDAQITTGLLEGFYCFESDIEYEGLSIIEFLSRWGMPLLLQCYNMKGVRQEAGMRIMCKRLCGAPKDSLIIPIDAYDTSVCNIDTPFIETQKTARIILRKQEVNFDEDMKAFLEILEAQGYETTGVPIVELLIDPGDVPGMNDYVAAFHSPIK